MDINYKILFSLQSRRAGTQGAFPGISFVPTADCTEQMRRHGMLFKNVGEENLVGIEIKEIGPAGDQPQSLKAVRPISQLSSFTFLITLEHSGLLNDMEPYKSARFESDLSATYFLYFDNIRVDFPPREETELSRNGTSSSSRDIFFGVPERLSLAGLNELEYTQQIPGGAPVRVVPDPAHRNPINITLSPAAYILKRSGGGGQITDPIFAGLREYSQKVIGIARIFKNAETDYQLRRNYTITLG